MEGVGHIDFGADPVDVGAGVGVGVTLSWMYNILWTSGWIRIKWQTACLVIKPVVVDGSASLFNCTTAVRASDSMTASS